MKKIGKETWVGIVIGIAAGLAMILLSLSSFQETTHTYQCKEESCLFKLPKSFQKHLFPDWENSEGLYLLLQKTYRVLSTDPNAEDPLVEYYQDEEGEKSITLHHPAFAGIALTDKRIQGCKVEARYFSDGSFKEIWAYCPYRQIGQQVVELKKDDPVSVRANAFLSFFLGSK